MTLITTTLVIVIAAEVASMAMPYRKPKNQPCASDYRQSGSYCIPARPDSAPAISKTGNCPSGWWSEAGVCLKKR
jgi:hypothetical protein